MIHAFRSESAKSPAMSRGSPRTSGHVIARATTRYTSRAPRVSRRARRLESAGTDDWRASVVHEFAYDDGQDRSGRDSEDGADQSPQRSANEQRDHDGDRTDADPCLHDLGNENIRLELMEHDEVDTDHERELRRIGQRNAHGRDPADDGSD